MAKCHNILYLIFFDRSLYIKYKQQTDLRTKWIIQTALIFRNPWNCHFEPMITQYCIIFVSSPFISPVYSFAFFVLFFTMEIPPPSKRRRYLAEYISLPGNAPCYSIWSTEQPSWGPWRCTYQLAELDPRPYQARSAWGELWYTSPLVRGIVYITSRKWVGSGSDPVLFFKSQNQVNSNRIHNHAWCIYGRRKAVRKKKEKWVFQCLKSEYICCF